MPTPAAGGGGHGARPQRHAYPRLRSRESTAPTTPKTLNMYGRRCPSRGQRQALVPGTRLAGGEAVASGDPTVVAAPPDRQGSSQGLPVHRHHHGTPLECARGRSAHSLPLGLWGARLPTVGLRGRPSLRPGAERRRGLRRRARRNLSRMLADAKHRRMLAGSQCSERRPVAGAVRGRGRSSNRRAGRWPWLGTDADTTTAGG